MKVVTELMAGLCS